MKVKSMFSISKTPFLIVSCYQRAQELLKEEEDDDASVDADDMDLDGQEAGEGRTKGKKMIPPVPPLPKVNGAGV
jgi:hypothetical protein